MLALELLGLCCVHTLILGLLMVEVRLPGSKKRKEVDEEEGGDSSEEEESLLDSKGSPKKCVNGSPERVKGELIV